MPHWLNILIDISVLAALGLIYYLVQRHRIVRNDLNDIYHQIDELITKLHEFLDTRKNESYYNEVNSFVESLEKALEKNDPNLINQTLEKIPSDLPDEIKNIFIEIKKNILFHINKG